MKRHPAIGDDLCRTVRSFEAVRPIVRHHHERLDGRGYPDGLAGDRIPLLAQIVSIVDVFDALTTDHPAAAPPTTPNARSSASPARATVPSSNSRPSSVTPCGTRRGGENFGSGFFGIGRPVAARLGDR